MKKVFTHENRLIVFNIKNLLQEQGIACQMRNEFAGGGVGDLAPFETWPEIWVDDIDAIRAENALTVLQKSEPGACKCPTCGAENDANFVLCWQCSQPLDMQAG